MTGKLKEGKNVCILSSLITDKLSFVFILLVSMILFLFLCWQCYIGAKTTEHMSTIESRLLEELVDNVEDSSKTDKNLLYCKESLHAELRLIKARFEDFSSSITLILSVVTIVFVIFSFLGLMKIQDELKHLEKDKEEFERKMEDKLKGMDDERERHKREMSDNLQEMQEIQDKTRVESLLSQFRYKEADMICRKYEGMGYPYFIYASARVEMDRENYKGARERLENVIHLFYKDVQNEYSYYLGETDFYLEEFELAGRYVLKAMEVLQSKSSLPGLDSSKKDLRIIDETCTSSQYTLSRYSCLLGRIYLSTIQGDSPENNNTFEKALSAFAEALR